MTRQNMTNTARTVAPISISYADAAAAVGVSRRTLERAVARGDLRAVPVSPRRRVIPVTDLIAWATGDRALAAAGSAA